MGLCAAERQLADRAERDDQLLRLPVLRVRDEREEAVAGLGQYLVRHWEHIGLLETSGGSESLVYWLRKLVFRGAWLDHRVKEGKLEVTFDEDAADFAYSDPGGGRALLELEPVPSWHELQFRK